MLETIFLLLVGAIIGWRFPEPAWAKIIRDKVLSIVRPKE